MGGSGAVGAAGEEAPEGTEGEADAVDDVGDIADEADEADDEPDEHHEDGLLVQEEAGGGIEFAANPDEAEESVNDTGHAAEVGAAPPVLGEVGAEGDAGEEEEEVAGAKAGFDEAAEVFEPKHVEEEVDEPEVEEGGGEEAPQFAALNFGKPARGGEVAAAAELFGDFQGCGGGVVVAGAGGEEDAEANYDEEEGDGAEGDGGVLGEDAFAAPLAADGGFGCLGFLLPEGGGFAGVHVKLGGGGVGEEAFEALAGLGELVVFADPERPAAVGLGFNFVPDAAQVEEVAEFAGGGFGGQMTDVAHVREGS